MSIVTAFRARQSDADGLPALSGTPEGVARAIIVRRRAIRELSDLIDTYLRVVKWHDQHSAEEQFLRARRTSLTFYRTQTDAAVILRYYDPGYLPES